jgi:Uma2 family endonuclease
MIARVDLTDRDLPQEDHFVHLRGATWADYQRLLEIRGDHSAPRITYLEGTLEIMSPSLTRESIKSVIGRLVEVWCLERDVEFSTYGSWTLMNKRAKCGAEPDECYEFRSIASAAHATLHRRTASSCAASTSITSLPFSIGQPRAGRFATIGPR